jgi:hypothetical protein
MGEKWTLIGKTKTLQKGDRGMVDGVLMVVKFVDPDHNVYAVPAASITKSEGKPSMFGNLINREGEGAGVERVRKSYGDATGKEYTAASIQQPMVATEFIFEGGMLVRKDPFVDLKSGRSQDATVAPVWSADHFPADRSTIVGRPASGADGEAPRPIAPPYQFEEPSESDLTASGTIKPNFLPDGMKEDMTREMFSVPGEQARVATDDADAGDFDGDDSVDPFDALDTDRDAGQPMQSRTRRLGSGYVLKAARFDRRGKK